MVKRTQRKQQKMKGKQKAAVRRSQATRAVRPIACIGRGGQANGAPEANGQSASGKRPSSGNAEERTMGQAKKGVPRATNTASAVTKTERPFQTTAIPSLVHSGRELKQNEKVIVKEKGKRKRRDKEEKRGGELRSRKRE